MSDDQLALTIPAAAMRLGMSVRALRRLIDDGRITVRYPTSRPVIEVSELRDFLASAPTEKPIRRRAS